MLHIGGQRSEGAYPGARPAAPSRARGERRRGGEQVPPPRACGLATPDRHHDDRKNRGEAPHATGQTRVGGNVIGRRNGHDSSSPRGTPAVALVGCSPACCPPARAPGRGSLRSPGNMEVTQVEASFRVPGQGRGAARGRGPGGHGWPTPGPPRRRGFQAAGGPQAGGRRRGQGRPGQAPGGLPQGGDRAPQAARWSRPRPILARAQADDLRNTELLQKGGHLPPRVRRHPQRLSPPSRPGFARPREHYDLVKNGPAPKEDIEQARAALDAAEQALALARDPARICHAHFGPAGR